jgi:hypothetical protein
MRMKGDDTKAFPKDPKLDIFAHTVDIVRANSALRILLGGIGMAFFAISPKVPDTFGTTLENRPTRAGFWWGASLSLFFCLIVTGFWSVLDGTFSGIDSSRMYFWHDPTDLINFGVLCPFYVGLSIQLVVLFLRCWNRLSIPSGFVVEGAPRLPFASVGTSIFLILSIGTAGTVNYIRETLNPAVLQKVGWWVGHVAPDGSRVLSPLGIYYALIIFVLLSICVMAALAFMSLFFLCIRFGKIVGNQPTEGCIDIEAIRGMLSDFTQAYIVLKLLAITLVANVYTWGLESLKGSMNFLALNLVLVLFGVFLISVPRYYIELEWFRFRVRRSQANNTPDSLESDDLRPFSGRLVAWVADGLVLSSFFFSFLLRYVIQR